MSQPISFHVDRPAHQSRLHVLIRLILLCALGSIGLSGVYFLLYLGLPAVVALVLSQKSGQQYLADDGPKIVRALRWVAAAYAYLWLLTDEMPGSGSSVHFEVQPDGAPAPGSALLRLVLSIPALLLMVLLTIVSGVLWVIGAFFVLVQEELPPSIAHFLEQMLRYRFRLFGYHLSLTEEYPSLVDEHQAPIHQPG